MLLNCDSCYFNYVNLDILMKAGGRTKLNGLIILLKMLHVKQISHSHEHRITHHSIRTGFFLY